MTTISVLLVDDQPFVGMALRRLLASEADITIHCCHDAAQAIDDANRLQPSMILQDLVLPGTDGLTLVGLFRRNAATRATPIVVLSGNDDADTRQRAEAAGASGYLVKLPPKSDLVACIRRHATAAADAGEETLDPTVIAGFRGDSAETAAFTVSLIDQFIVEAQSRVEALHDAVKRDDAPALRAGAHSLRGSSHIMGARRLGALCGEIEERSRTGEVPAALIEAVDAELGHVRAAFAVERQRAYGEGTGQG